jgi:hypothetical protein
MYIGLEKKAESAPFRQGPVNVYAKAIALGIL